MDLRKLKKSKNRDAKRAAEAEAPTSPQVGSEPGGTIPEVDAAADPGASGATDAEERAEIADRAEIAEVMYAAALARGDIAEAREREAAERLAAVEAMERTAAERAATVDAMEQAAAERAAAVEAIEKAAAERAAAVEAREQFIAERAAAIEAREKAAAERDAIANSRDRNAVERDSIANTRDKAAVERDSMTYSRLTAGRDGAAAEGDAALERARLEAELQRAHLDALTGAFRREMGRLALRNEIERARRADGKFVIAYIDVDGLKGVNDRDGHAAGDRLLRTLVATMRANLRSYDPIVRLGGDEFVCGISSIDPGEVQHRIGVIDQSLRSATGVGITAGLASLTSNESLDELTARADAALIEAKRHRGE